MPFRFFFGGRREQDEGQVAKSNEMDEEELSEMGDLEESLVYCENALNEVYFTNPDFDPSSARATPVSPAPSLPLATRQYMRRLSSKLREHRRIPSVDASELDVDVVLSPSAFAFQNVPNALRGNSFCSRDDSEIATRTMVANLSRNGRGSSCRASPYVNALYLHNYSFDDSDIGSCTLEKPVRLRHMGSALSYRLELSATPEGSTYADEDASTYTGPRHSRRHSDMSERVASFKERNKMIRLESLVGGIERADSSVLEFGILNPDALHALQNQPTPRLFRSSSAKDPNVDSSLPDLIVKNPVPVQQFIHDMDASRVESFPITLLSHIEEEDEDESELEFQIDEKKEESVKENDNRSESSLSAPSLFVRRDVTRSSFKVRVTAPDISEIQKDEGFVNPAFESGIDTPMANQTPSAKEPMLRMTSTKKQKKKAKKSKDSDFLSSAPSRRKEKRDETLHTALMERYLVQSVVNKYLVE